VFHWWRKAVDHKPAAAMHSTSATTVLLSAAAAAAAAAVPLQHIHVLELFAGGGGLSYIAQRNDKVVITTAYANDINNSAAATYTANHPQAFVSGFVAS
jgi:hypothetical protein